MSTHRSPLFETTRSIYGEGMGRYGVDPVILVHTSNDVGRPTSNWFPTEPPGAPTTPMMAPPPSKAFLTMASTFGMANLNWPF